MYLCTICIVDMSYIIYTLYTELNKPSLPANPGGWSENMDDPFDLASCQARMLSNGIIRNPKPNRIGAPPPKNGYLESLESQSSIRTFKRKKQHIFLLTCIYIIVFDVSVFLVLWVMSHFPGTTRSVERAWGKLGGGCTLRDRKIDRPRQIQNTWVFLLTICSPYANTCITYQGVAFFFEKSRRFGRSVAVPAPENPLPTWITHIHVLVQSI